MNSEWETEKVRCSFILYFQCSSYADFGNRIQINKETFSRKTSQWDIGENNRRDTVNHQRIPDFGFKRYDKANCSRQNWDSSKALKTVSDVARLIHHIWMFTRVIQRIWSHKRGQLFCDFVSKPMRQIESIFFIFRIN